MTGKASDRTLIGVRAYAREIGISHSTISRQIRAGIITNRGKPGRPLVDPAEADRERAENVDRSRSSTAGLGLAAGAGIETEAPAAATGGGELPLEAPAPARPTNGGGTYHEARTERELFAARTAKLAYFEKVGELVSRAEVERAAHDAARQLRDALLVLPRELAAELAAVTDERAVEARLKGAIRERLDHLSRDLAEDAPEEAEGEAEEPARAAG